MSDPAPQNNSLFAIIKLVSGWIGAGIAFIASLVSFIQLVKGNAQLVSSVILLVSIVAVWGSLFYIRFWKIKTHVPGTVRTLPREEIGYAYGDRERRLALIGIIAVPLICLAGYAILLYQQRQPPDKIIILVADFQNLATRNLGITERILDYLQEATGNFPDVKVEALKKTITSQDTSAVAKAEGAARHAAIVIWGTFTDTKLTVHFDPPGQQTSYVSLKRGTQFLESAVTGLDQSIEVQMQLSSDPAYITLLTVGLARYEAQDYDGAIERLTKALELPHTPEELVDPANTYFARGKAYSEKREYDLAIKDYTEAIKRNPVFGGGYLYRGFAYRNKSEKDDDEMANLANADFDKAIDLYSEALARSPNDAETFSNRGIALNNRENYRRDSREYYQRAINDFNKALALKPDLASAYNNRGLTYLNNKELDRAIADFSQAIKLKPDDARQFNNRGGAYDRKGQRDDASKNYDHALKSYDHALKDYCLALKLKPTMASAYYNEALIYTDRRQYDRVFYDYDQAIKLQPKFALAYHNRAWAHVVNNSGDGAVNDARTYLNLKGWRDKNALYMVLVAHFGYRQNNRQAEAMQILDEAMNNCDLTKWPATAIRYLRHEVNAQDVLNATDDNEHLTEAKTYLGMDLSLSGDRASALPYLSWVKDCGENYLEEYRLSLAEIARIEAAGVKSTAAKSVCQ